MTQPVTSPCSRPACGSIDAHRGLVNAIGAVMAGTAWQRCRVHFMRNALAKVSKGHAEMVAATVRTIFAQPGQGEVRTQVDLTQSQPAVRAGSQGEGAVRRASAYPTEWIRLPRLDERLAALDRRGVADAADAWMTDPMTRGRLAA